jgi:DNA polymerase III sliding clamp (beta) subunit (PCNA family)
MRRAFCLIALNAEAKLSGIDKSGVRFFRNEFARALISSDLIVAFSASGMSATVRLRLTHPYRRNIKAAKATAKVQRKALVDAVGRCLPLCKAKPSAPIDLVHDIEGELIVRAIRKDGAEIEDRVEITGEQFALSLDGGMLARTLDTFSGDKIEVGLVAIGDIVRFGEPGKEHRLAIIMPMVSRLTHRIGPPRRNAAE